LHQENNTQDSELINLHAMILISNKDLLVNYWVNRKYYTVKSVMTWPLPTSRKLWWAGYIGQTGVRTYTCRILLWKAVRKWPFCDW